MPRPAQALLVFACASLLVACGGQTGGGGGEGNASQDRTVEVTIGEGVSADESGTKRGDGGAPQPVSRAAGNLPGDCPGETLRPKSGNLDRIERATRCLLNAIRRKRDLGALSQSGALAQAATAHSRDMAQRNYFAHVAPGGKDVVAWVRGTGYLQQGNGWRLGENIGWGNRGAATPAQMVTGWMNSKSHRKNILDGGFNDLGVGVVAGTPTKDAEAGAIYTTIFGTQRNVAPG